MVSFFRQFAAWSSGFLFALGAVAVCADPAPQVSPDTDTRWSYDEVTAHLPRQQAEIPAVALAKINIALYQAKQLTEARLCSGKWTPRGALLYRRGPAVTTPASGAEPGARHWFFQSFRRPATLACADVTRAEYFLEMSRHLPAWISIRPAGQVTAFRLGQVFTEGQGSLAAR